MEIIQKVFMKIPAFLLSLYFSVFLIAPPVVLAQMQGVVDLKETSEVFVYVGDLVTVKVDSLTRIAVANPGIVDITNVTAEEITLVGRKPGETQIFVWDESGKREFIALVLGTDLGRISQRIAALLQSADIKGITFEKNYYEGRIVLNGYLTKNEKEKFDKIIGPFSEFVFDMVIEEGDLIQIDVQFSELNVLLANVMGFDWNSAFDVTEALPSQDGSLKDLFKIGDFSRTTAITSVVNLLISEGKARLLSKPSLVVTNGEEASFLVGGEVPIRTTTTSVGGGSAQENVEYKEYGVDLTVTPEIIDGKIDITVNVTVRDVDQSASVGQDTAFLTRTATTKVRLADGQTIVLAGMIANRKSVTVNRVPFVSKVPIVGLLFQNKSQPNRDTELVVSLTPRILKRMPKEKEQPAKIESKKEALLAQEPKPDEPPKDINKKPEEEVPSKEIKAPEAVKSKPAEEIKKTPAQIKAEKKAAALKAKNEAKEAAIIAKKEKEAKAKREKEEKIKAKKEKADAKAKASQEAKLKKKKKSSSPSVQSKEPASAPKQSARSSIDVDAKVDDPSLNLALDDPRLADPQNVLTESQIVEIKEKYAKKIKSEMEETISYPYEAKASKWEGTAVLNITILPDGNVKDVSVKQSSGYAVFDKDAVNTAQILAPFDRYSPAKNLKEMVISVPVEYSEKAILGEVNP